VVEELVPPRLRPLVSEQVDTIDAHALLALAALEDGQPLPAHPWRASTVGEPALYAAATLSVWLSRQPQINAHSAVLVREGLVDEITATRARIAGVAPTTVTDEDAIGLLVHIHHGEDVLQVPADPRARSRAQVDAVFIATQWLREHEGATPTEAQAPNCASVSSGRRWA
jgi:hypothetical protein